MEVIQIENHKQNTRLSGPPLPWEVPEAQPTLLYWQPPPRLGSSSPQTCWFRVSTAVSRPYGYPSSMLHPFTSPQCIFLLRFWFLDQCNFLSHILLTSQTICIFLESPSSLTPSFLMFHLNCFGHMHARVLSHFSCVQLLTTLWTVTCQAPPSHS